MSTDCGSSPEEEDWISRTSPHMCNTLPVSVFSDSKKKEEKKVHPNATNKVLRSFSRDPSDAGERGRKREKKVCGCLVVEEREKRAAPVPPLRPRRCALEARTAHSVTSEAEPTRYDRIQPAERSESLPMMTRKTFNQVVSRLEESN